MDVILYFLLMFALMAICGITIYALIAQTNEIKKVLDYWGNKIIKNIKSNKLI